MCIRGFIWILIGTVCLVASGFEVAYPDEPKDKPVSKEKRAADWAKRLAASRDPRKEFDRMIARGKDGNATASAMIDWESPLKDKLPEEPKTIELLLFVGSFDPLWKADKYEAERSKELAGRIKHLPKETIKEWNNALEVFDKDGVNEMWAIGLMVSLDRLFTKDSFKGDESKLLLARLKALPEDAVASVGEPLNIGLAMATIAIIQEDSLFEKAQLDKKTFDQAVKQLKELIPKK